jgi:hypothetical protein
MRMVLCSSMGRRLSSWLVSSVAFDLVTLVGAGCSSSSNLFDRPGDMAITLPGAIVEDASEYEHFRFLDVFLNPHFFLLETFWTSYKQQ